MDGEAVAAEVGSWDGVEASGGELRYDGRLLGRVGSGGAEIAFQPGVARMLVETGRAEAHENPRRVSFAGETAEAVELFRLAYERARVAERVRRG